jgi:hypothetical protein
MPNQPIAEGAAPGGFALLEDLQEIDASFFGATPEDEDDEPLRGPWHPVFGDVPDCEPAV